MEDIPLEKLKYPIGHFVRPSKISTLMLRDWIAQIEALPVNLRDLVTPLSEAQLNSPYRPGDGR
ncbi:hypothetical protein [Muriicola soli]|uniref:hypothetical protein n=1 Tax=Muriicola soli TaxID=2507538 RepID=UPI00319E4A5B